ncbi:MAG: threonine--tRNA ligase [Bacteroidetes bacterium]|nr:threonine--tRNA ligase [Bacteroidota bacterium]MBT5990139.1 threonine--tRNA ligase [Bacteroidota bacterium]MBT6834424.1 threonine--tRNA ligase [Bacteroidota bacterium]MBT7039064.1 threonine--tRNA ligase [Bacteroidota bacterium]
MMNITFPDGSIKEFDQGVSGYDIAMSISPRLAKEALGVKVNNDIWDLTRPIQEDSKISILKWDDPAGKMVFWHSSAHLMAEAIESVFPGTKFGIGPPIENGFYYDVDSGEKEITQADLEKLERKMKELQSEKSSYVREDISKNDALSLFSKKDDEYKQELISDLEDGDITLYKHGNFVDLCKGPHLPNTSYIKAVKLFSIAGAYWRGDESRKQLTRIYGITFPKQKMLEEHLVMLEEAQKRDHRKVGRELEIFMTSDKVGAGLPIWLPNGVIIREKLIDFLKKEQRKRGYVQVIAPVIGKKELYVTSGHYAKYGKDSFQPIKTPSEGEEYMLKPMNCPHHCEVYKNRPHSYKELPLKIAEFGNVYRYEQSGELNGLVRARGFTQDDAHIFCTPDQLKEEFLDVVDIIELLFRKLGFEEFTAQISLRDPENKEKYIGTDEVWEKSERAIIEAVEEKGLNAVTEIGEAAFYGPKLDFMVKDALGRQWQLGTVQVDYNLPERFDLTYIGEDNQKHRPVMIHRAPFGSMERFIGLLIEHTAGDFPLWLAPKQAIILPISDKYINYAKNIWKSLDNYEIRTSIDDSNEKIGRKIRDAELSKIPYMLIVGEREETEGLVSVRKRKSGDLGQFKLDDFINSISEELK